MFNGTEDLRPAQRLSGYDGMAKEAEPDIVRAARVFDEARRALDHLQLERQKIDEAMKDAQDRMNESAKHIRALIEGQVSVEKARY